MAGEHKRQKKRKLKISTASASGNRVVFDEDGQAQDRAANERLQLEKRVRGLQEDNRAIREELEAAKRGRPD